MQQRSQQRGASDPQFLPVVAGEFAEEFLPFGGEAQQNLTAVFTIAPAADVPALRQTIGQFDGAVVAELQPFRQNSDPRAQILRKPFDGQQELMLAWFYLRLACRLFTEVQELADLVAQLGERLIIRQGKSDHGVDYIEARPMYIVTRCV
jgi:hypothetical protein